MQSGRGARWFDVMNTERLRARAMMLVLLGTWLPAQGCAILSETSGAPGGQVVSIPKPAPPPRVIPQKRIRPPKREDKLPESSPGSHTGEASWYGPGFEGKKTANGEIFDDDKLTAAHPEIPLGSRVKVTRLENGKSVEVTINDRGPYAKGRVIDLSRAAARALDMIDDGVANVRVEVVSIADAEQTNR